MTLLAFDGFETWAWTTAQASGRGWSGSASLGAGIGGRYGVGRMLTFSTGTLLVKTLGSTPTTLYIGLAVYLPSSPNTGNIVRAQNGGNSAGGLGMDNSRNLWIQNRSGVNQGASIGTIPLAQWQYYEVKWVLGTTSANGSVEVRQGGVVLASRTGDFGGGTYAGATGVGFSNLQSVGNSYLDDIYVCDSAGSVNNTYLGEVREIALAPTGAGAHTALTPTGAANNWDCVDEVPPDDDTTYVASSTVNDIDTYALADLPGNVQTIVGVQTSLYARKDDVSARSIADVVRIAGTDHVGAGGALGATYSSLLTMYETSPASGLAWGISEINGMEVGVKVTA